MKNVRAVVLSPFPAGVRDLVAALVDVPHGTEEVSCLGCQMRLVWWSVGSNKKMILDGGNIRKEITRDKVLDAHKTRVPSMDGKHFRFQDNWETLNAWCTC